MNFQQPDMYYDNQPQNRSPNAQRHPSQTLHRQASRQFDSFAHLPSGLYTADDHARGYEPPRYNENRMAATMQPNYGGYDMGVQTWNNSAFGGNNNLAPLGATNRSMKPPQKGRAGIPNVGTFTHLQIHLEACANLNYRPGWTSSPSRCSLYHPT